jgi:hypothetical protein
MIFGTVLLYFGRTFGHKIACFFSKSPFFRSGALLGMIHMKFVRYRCAKRCFRPFGKVETGHISSTSEPDF